MRFIQFSILSVILTLTLTGCWLDGSGATTSATLSPSGTAPTISLSIVDASGVPVTSISNSTTYSVKATLRDTNGVAIQNSVVTFTTPTNLATMTPTNGTALTDVSGVASILLSPASITASGATIISASAQVLIAAGTTGTGSAVANTQTVVVTGTMGYSIVPPSGVTTPALSLSIVNAAGTAVTSISNASTFTAKATVNDATGAPVPNTVVTFTTPTNLATMTPTNGTALTDAAGVASILLAPANLSAAGATSISASAQVNTTAVSSSMGYSIGTTTVTISAPIFAANPLSAYGTTSVTVTVSSGGIPITTPQIVNFTSSCSDSGKAVLATGITTVSGLAVATYRDIGCAGIDTVSATVVGGLATSTSTLTVIAPAVGSIQYISANPTNISLKGSGGAPTSLVTFKVMDAGGNPISGKTVTLGLSTTVGGLSLATTSGVSDAAGLVVATVNAGTVSTPVRVTASTPGANGTTLTTQSSQLSITTGIPDQAGYSLSATLHNIEGWSVDGVTSVLTARLADHFKNPAPDGTTVNFTAEAGSVVATCNTTAGSCSTTFTSQGTRPTNGRTTLLAYAVGEETFTDLNGNGVADLLPTNEMIDANGVPTDLPEAYVDYNENGVRDAATEPFIDFNQDGLYTVADSKYSGVLCDNITPPPVGSSTGTCATAKSLHVRNSQIMVFSSSTAIVTINGGVAIALPPCVAGILGGPLTFTVTVVDVNGNAMPAGTTVNFTTSNGTITSSASYVVPDTTGCRTGYIGCPASAASATFGDIPVTMTSDATAVATAPTVSTCTNTIASGTFAVKVTSPKAVITTSSAGVTD